MVDLPAAIKRPQRWDNPFDPDMAKKDIDPILDLPPLNNINRKAFPSSASLKDILLNDSRVVKFKTGDIIVRKGDYGHSAFIILSGQVRVIIGDDLPEYILNRIKPKRKSFFGILSQTWKRRKYPEERNRSELESTTSQSGDLNKVRREHRTFIDNVQETIEAYNTVSLKDGNIFGEIAALCRTSRGATIFAENETELLEIRWQGLRDIRRRCSVFREYVDQFYRSRSAETILYQTNLFDNLSKEELSEIASKTEFKSFGEFEWVSSYNKIKTQDARTAIENEPVIVMEGDLMDGLIIVVGGVARISARINHGHRTVGYLTKGDSFGLEEITYNLQSETKLPLQRSLRAIGYADVLIVPTEFIKKYIVSPEKKLSDSTSKKLPPLSIALPETLDTTIEPTLLEFLMEHRYINGTATMLIDLNRCTRCDDCVRACSLAHSNQPRFIRQGRKSGRYLVANACMHCSDPVCLIGCPTAAIYREPRGGHVVINEQKCIGCQICAKNCPYQNIIMVKIRNNKGSLIIDEQSSQPILKATKCDYCSEQIVSPVCENACPHDALKRINMHSIKALEKWTER